MNRLLAAGVLALAGTWGGVAHAQSNVTIAGYLDASARQVRNSIGSSKSLSSGNDTTARLIVRGTEDLGDGLQAGFWLESSIYTDTGVAGSVSNAPINQFWDRTAVVKLSSAKWGEVRLGREWTPVFRGFLVGDPFLGVGVGGSLNFFSVASSTALTRAFGSPLNPATVSRSSNAIQYWLPPGLGGVYGQLMVAPSEGSNAQGNFKFTSGRLGWTNNTFDGSVYFGSTRIDAAGADIKMAGAYGSYNAGIMRLTGSVTETKFLSSKMVNYIIGVSVPFGQQAIRASYNRADQKGTDAVGASIDGNDGQMYALGYTYNLSKRTAMYAQAAYVTNKGNARFGIPGGPAGLIAAGSSTTGYEAGLRTSF